MRSRTDASEKPSCKIRAPSPRPARMRCWLSASAVTTTCSACLRARASCGLGLVLGDLDLHQRVRQLGLHLRLGLGLVEHAQVLGRGDLLRVGLDLLERQLPQPQLFEQRLDLAAGLLPCRACRSGRRRTRCRSCGTSGRSSLLDSCWIESRSWSSSSIVRLWATSRK